LPARAVRPCPRAANGAVFSWRDGRALEDELFQNLTDGAVSQLLHLATELHGKELVDTNIRSASQNAKHLEAIQLEIVLDGLSAASRIILGKASRSKKTGWFKSVSWMEEAAHTIIAPDLAKANAGFRNITEQVMMWSTDVG